MDAAKSKALDSTLRLVFSLAHGIFLVFCIILVYVVFGESRMPSFWILLTILTLTSYVVGLFLNAIIQYLACSKLNAIQLISSSSIPAGITAAIITIMNFVSSVEYPILSVLPETLTPLYQKALSQGFYVFWAGLYGQLFASGFVQICAA